MRHTFAVFMAVSSVLVFAAGVMAGDYHTGSSLKCYQCHIMHETKGHLYADDADDNFNPGGAVTVSPGMLRQPDVSALCLSCHDGGTAIDVYGDASQGGQPVHRSAGHFNGNAMDSYAPFASLEGHNLNNGIETPPGGSMSYNLSCTSCHDPHGNDYYRNLKDFGAGGVTYAKTTNDLSKDVFVLKPYPENGTAEAYEAANISYNRSQAIGHRLEKFCVGCHTSIHSDTKLNADWLQHPTVGSGRAYIAGTVSPLKTLGGRPVAGQAGDPVAGHVSCVTCHKAHGSSHPFGLIYDDRTTVEIEDGVESIRETCQHCHSKGLIL